MLYSESVVRVQIRAQRHALHELECMLKSAFPDVARGRRLPRTLHASAQEVQRREYEREAERAVRAARKARRVRTGGAL